MSKISEYLSHGHQHCDGLFVAAENAVADGRMAEAETGYCAFRDEMETHFTMEETVMFPAFEAATGMVGGPTEVMRSEHVQMRELLAQMQAAFAKPDAYEYLGLSETLLMIMQQHNFKEEQILYAMADQALESDAAAIIERMKAVEIAH
ncbi:MAG TPA: hemerythrin domain-containing protein [Novimethylophilus sp.]|jgi:iron-sulfur cluster repair protein YtfE (RIC family)|uniref:hemerythrin domain-containing protein n=1 Tax=Novimethylophilus sp. TaxID=2137426 RepID=UPI002F41CCA6